MMNKKLPLLAWALRSNQITILQPKNENTGRIISSQIGMTSLNGRSGETALSSIKNLRSSFFHSSSSALSSSFVPPEPPSSNGKAVFDDIIISTDGTLESLKRNSDPDAVFVVTGASRGIGLQFVKSLIHRTKGTIIACCRSPSTAEGLNEYLASLEQQQRGRVMVVALDLEDPSSIEDLGEKVKEEFNRVDILLNVAGILGDGEHEPGPERSLRKLDKKWLEKSLAVNTIAPILLCQSLTPMMRVPKKNLPSERATSIIVNLSARVGSISDNNGLGGWYSYRISKSALNMATRTMSHELKRQGTWTLSLHPGTTDTDLSQPFQKNVVKERLFPVEFTVQQLCNIIDSMEEYHTGGFYDWAGKALPF